MGSDDAQDFVIDYLDELAKVEVSSVDGTRRDAAGVARLLISLARNVSSEAATSTLAADRGQLLGDLETLGLLFESLCVRDLRVYAQPLRATLSHYRDNTGLEVDAILRRRNGDWIAVEVKLGGRAAVDAAAASLLRLRDRVDPAGVGEPKRLVVLTAAGYAYERTDGVAVTPITCLRP